MPTSTRKSKKSAKVAVAPDGDASTARSSRRRRGRVPQPFTLGSAQERQRYIENLRNQIKGREVELRQCKGELAAWKDRNALLRKENVTLLKENAILRRRLHHFAPGALRPGSPHGGGRRTYRRRRRRRRHSRRSVPS